MKKIVFIFLVPIYIFLFSCSIDSNDIKQQSETSFVNIDIEFPSLEHTALSGRNAEINRSAFTDLSKTKFGYKVFAQKDTETVEGKYSGTGNIFSIALSAGKWKVSVNAFNNADTNKRIIFKGEKTVNISIQADVKSIIIPLLPAFENTEKGSIKLPIKCIQNTGVKKISYKFINRKTAPYTGNSEINEKIITADYGSAQEKLLFIKENNIDAGTYGLSILFYDSYGNITYSLNTSATVLNGCTVNFWEEKEASGGILVITKDLVDKYRSSVIFVSQPLNQNSLLKAGSDTSGNGSYAAPFATISKAWELCTQSGVEYTIYIDGTIEGSFENGTKQNMNLHIAGLLPNRKSVIKNSSGSNKSVIHSGSGKALKLTIENLTISGGKGQNGGGIYFNSDKDLILKNCTISENNAQNGGGIYCASGNVKLLDCTILKNNASAKGKGIYFEGGNLELGGLIKTGNETDKNSVYIVKNKFLITDQKFPLKENSLIFLEPQFYEENFKLVEIPNEGLKKLFKLTDYKDETWKINFDLSKKSLFLKSNKVVFAGAGAWKKLKEEVSEAKNGDTIRIDGIVKATGGDNSGEILIQKEIKIKAKNKTSSDGLNAANLSRIFKIDAGGKLTVESLILSNGKGQNGGGIFISKGDVSLKDAVLKDCEALNGGGIYLEKGNCIIENTVINDNKITPVPAGGKGGAVYLKEGRLSLKGKIDLPFNNTKSNYIFLEDNKAIYTDNSLSPKISGYCAVVATSKSFTSKYNADDSEVILNLEANNKEHICRYFKLLAPLNENSNNGISEIYFIKPKENKGIIASTGGSVEINYDPAEYVFVLNKKQFKQLPPSEISFSIKKNNTIFTGGSDFKISLFQNGALITKQNSKILQLKEYPLGKYKVKMCMSVNGVVYNSWQEIEITAP